MNNRTPVSHLTIAETEKAIKVSAVVQFCNGEDRTASVWFPKSQIDEAGTAPQWLVGAKMKELREKFHPASRPVVFLGFADGEEMN
jgi:hypothetical protein